MKFIRTSIYIFLFIFIGNSMNPQKVEAAIPVSARNAILMEQESGRVLFEKRAHEKRRIASITKIMTAIIAIESGKLDEMVTVSERAVRTEGSSIYLQPKEKMKLEDLVYGLMLRSGNDAAVAIAEHVGGSVEGFTFLMNEKAAQLGMRNTNFANPHGLDDSNEHYSTAYDMAILTKYAMENEKFREISATKVHRAPNPNEEWDRIWTNKNKLLTKYYKYSTGGKTGFTKLAKRTLVSTAEKGDMELIAVTLNAPDDWNDHIQMFETGFQQYKMVQVIESGTVKGIDDPFYKKKVYFQSDFFYPVTKEEEDQFQIDINLLAPKKEWRRIDSTPDVVGKAVIYFKNEKVKELPLYYEEPKEENEPFFKKMKRIFTLTVGVRSND